MDDEKKSVKKEVQDTMACSAFAEAGEPCPLHEGEEGQEKKDDDTEIDVEGTMACTAFAEASEPCPIDTDKKKEEKEEG